MISCLENFFFKKDLLLTLVSKLGIKKEIKKVNFTPTVYIIKVMTINLHPSSFQATI